MVSKIMFLLPSNVAGGAERVMISLANEFAEIGIEVYLIIFDRDSVFYPVHKAKEIHLGFDAMKSGGGRKYIQFPLCCRTLKKWMKKFQPDIVISFAYITSLIGYLCCKQLNIPFIVSERTDPIRYRKLHSLTMKKIYPKISGFVYQTYAIRNRYASEFGIKNSIVIPNPITPEQVGEKKDCKKREIITAGRLIPEKNHMLLIDAFAKLDGKEEYKLVIYGEGALRNELETRIHTLGLTDRILLPGVEFNALKNHNDAELFVLSSNVEGYPNALIEAMANGIPCIAADVPSGVMREIIQDRVNGYLFKAGDAESLTACMHDAIKNPLLREKISKQALNDIDDLMIGKIACKWIDYMNLIAGDI